MRIFVAQSEMELRKLLSGETMERMGQDDVIFVDQYIALTQDLEVSVSANLFFTGKAAELDTNGFALKINPGLGGNGHCPILCIKRA